ncbi:DUF305 domain-containing protein [Lentisalinibacter sediminis]|uniref:DUF305 domain-containing protein n=1 Tax=Lentisalinibacter sediminis TaxID=2992237 RepID=UPI0038700E6C
MQHTNTGYFRFVAMIATSMIVMLALMYVNTYQWAHVRWSETRFLMMFVMGGGMGIVMLSFMLGMYRNRTMNVLIYLASVLVIAVAIGLVRSQATVQDASYMKAMIPHHSIAILTSERAGIRDMRVRRLATEIIATQRSEIEEMEWLLDDIRKNGIAATREEANARRVPTFEGSR